MKIKQLILMSLVALFSGAAFGETLVLEGGESIIVSEDLIVKCEGEAKVEEWKCTINTTVSGHFYSVVGYGSSKDAAEERAMSNCHRETGSMFACSLVRSSCKQLN